MAESFFAESDPSFDELYTWQFDGPATRDFIGAKVAGPRNAGAIHVVQPLPVMATQYDSAGVLHFFSPEARSCHLMRSIDDMQSWQRLQSETTSGAVHFYAPLDREKMFHRVEYAE